MGNAGDRWSANSLRESKSEEIIRTLEIIFQKDKTVLDIGCNTGELLDFAKSQGCRTFGVELSETSREVLMKKGHVPFPSIDDASGSYDIITAFDLVEHLYVFPAFLENCQRRLNKDGLIVILTGNISSLSARVTRSNWWYLKYPEHILFISKYYFEHLCGMRISCLIRTYASVGYKHSFAGMCKGFIMGWLKGNYQGLPSLGPDHVLVVFKK
jgi:cyclopropane fatty-acyl-phospholipid synthase-like methyltransferase